MCDKSPAHHKVIEAVERAERGEPAVVERPLVFRGPEESRRRKAGLLQPDG